MDKREKVVKKQLVDSYEDFLNSFNEYETTSLPYKGTEH